MEYKYSPLSSSQNEIRVITLLPAEFNSPIKCSIKHALHNEDLYYEALSYTWGEAVNRTNIMIAGKNFCITKSLSLALHYLRSETEPRYIWIDAICINQSDINERNAQVGRMASIYQLARKVNIWLGPPDKSSKLAMLFLKDVDKRVVYSIENKRRMSDIEAWTVEHFRNPSNKPLWDDIAQLWARAYWTRIWIIQEVVFGTSRSFQCIVQCGNDFVFWETLEILDRAMALVDQSITDNEHSNVDLLQIAKGARLDISWFLAIHGTHTRNRELPLSYVLIRQGRYKATDPRDKIYALLSMVHESQAYGLTVDYGLSTAEVYVMALKEIVLREQRLGVLCACCRECHRRAPKVQLPSWCPDWGTDPMDECCPARLWSYTKAIYLASGSLVADVRFHSTADGKFVLSTRGWVLDTISTLKVTFTESGFPDTTCLEFLCRGLIQQEPEGLNCSGTLLSHEAVWRTLVANRGISQDEPPDSFQKAYYEIIDEERCLDPVAATHYKNKVKACLRKRLLCKSLTRLLPGLVPETAVDGDIVCILVGCALPLILRKVQHYYIIVGEAYIHGFMYGEILQMELRGEVMKETFDIY